MSPTDAEAVGIGALLRQRREARGLGVEECAERLYLPASVLEALEAEHFSRLGASIYARGHLRRYAGLLDMDATALEQRMLRQLDGAPDLSAIVTHRVGDTRPVRRLGLVPVAAVTLVLGVSVLMWWSRHAAEAGGTSSLSTPPARPATPAPTPPAPAASSAPETVPTAAAAPATRPVIPSAPPAVRAPPRPAATSSGAAPSPGVAAVSAPAPGSATAARPGPMRVAEAAPALREPVSAPAPARPAAEPAAPSAAPRETRRDYMNFGF